MAAIPPISSLSAIGPTSPVSTGPVRTAPSVTSVQQFQSLLQNSQASPPMLYGTNHPSAVGRLVQAEDQLMQGVLSRADAFTAQSRTMDLNTLVAGQMQLMGEMTAAMTHLTIGASVAQSGKSAVQNLFKNQ